MRLITRLLGRGAKSNRALTLVTSSYAGHPATRRLIKSLPGLAVVLRHKAKQHSKKIASSQLGYGQRQLLAECIIDIELLGGFDEVLKFTGDAGLASCYIDAVLFEATGKEPGAEPTEAQYRDEGTQVYRGVAKYARVKDHFRVPDPVGWLFGKECSAILSGSAKDVAYIAAVLPLSVGLRAEGKWKMRYALTGKAPSQSEENALSAMMVRPNLKF